MSALTSRPAIGVGVSEGKAKASGFLHIVRHGTGVGTMYVVTYHRLHREAKAPVPGPMLAENPQLLIEMLERLGVDLRLREVRGALADVLRFGSANIPDLWLNDGISAQKGLADS
jgi:hypothetical protein